MHRFEWDEHLQRLMAVHFFGLLWGQAFILAVGNLAIAGAAAGEQSICQLQILKFHPCILTHPNLTYFLSIASFSCECDPVVFCLEWFLADDKKVFSSPAISSALRACRYHLGTCAFGSFIIAVVQVIFLCLTQEDACAKKQNCVLSCELDYLHITHVPAARMHANTRSRALPLALSTSAAL
jgi:hypothetical protein